MALRDTLNNNSAVVTIGAVTILVVALGIFFMQAGGGSTAAGSVPTEKYFYDEGTKKLYKVPWETLSPSTAPSGGQGYEAIVMTCAEKCGGKDLDGMTAEEVAEAGMFIGYLERMSDASRKRMEQIRAENPDAPMGMMMMEMYDSAIRRVQDEQWYPQNNPRSGQIHKQIREQCPELRYPNRCFPGSE